MPLVTWSPTAATGKYNDGNNWSSATPPGPIDAAIFGTTSQKDLTVSGNLQAGEWVFIPGAPKYSLTLDPAFATVDLIGGGVIVNGGAAHIILPGASDILAFDNTSTAGASSITNNGGQIDIDELSTAGSANISNGGQIFFANLASAGAATIHTTSSGSVEFDDFSTGGNAEFNTDLGGKVDFSHSSGPAGNHVISVGSIAGAGTYDLGSNQLVVGGNGLPTTVSGPVDDGGLLSSSMASLVKVGNARLTLSGSHNTYSGGTTIKQGTLDLVGVGAAGTGAIAFAGHATLRVENAALLGRAFGNPIEFFAKKDVLDLSGLHFLPGATATYHKAGHHLTVHSGSVTDILTLLSPHGTIFTAASDGHGGTKVTVEPLPGVGSLPTASQALSMAGDHGAFHMTDYIFAA